MEILFNVILITATLVLFFGSFTIVVAWEEGGEFYIDDFKGRRKSWVERLLDGLEYIHRV